MSQSQPPSPPESVDEFDQVLGKYGPTGMVAMCCAFFVVFLVVCAGVPAAIIYFLVQWANWLTS